MRVGMIRHGANFAFSSRPLTETLTLYAPTQDTPWCKMISFTEAANMANVSLSTIRRAVNDGRLSKTILSNGDSALDPSEVERVFPSNRPRHSTPTRKALHETATAQTMHDASPAVSVECHALVQDMSQQITDLVTLLARSDKRLDQLLEDKRKLELDLDACRQKSLLLLEDKRAAPVATNPVLVRKKEPTAAQKRGNSKKAKKKK